MRSSLSDPSPHGHIRATSTQLSDLSWDDLRIVKAVGDKRNLAAAATVVGLNQSTVFRRLAQIERSLAITLFERRRSGYDLTAAGTELFVLAERLEIDIVAVASRLAGLRTEPEGTLKIATNDSFALHLLTRLIKDFHIVHPGVRIDVVIGNAAVNLARGESDVAIRATNCPPENLVGRRIATVAWAGYRKADAPLKSDEATELYQQLWVTYSDDLAGIKAARRVEDEVSPGNIAFRINSVEGVAAAVAAGLGVGYLPCFVGDQHRDLVRITSIDESLSDELWLLTHPDLRKSGRVHNFLEFCAARLIRQRAMIEGKGAYCSVIPQK